MDSIKYRRKQFFTLLLAVILTFMPAMAAWAATNYEVENKGEEAPYDGYTVYRDGKVVEQWDPPAAAQQFSSDVVCLEAGDTIVFTENKIETSPGIYTYVFKDETDFIYRSHAGSNIGNPSNTCFEYDENSGKITVEIETINGISYWGMDITLGSAAYYIEQIDFVPLENYVEYELNGGTNDSRNPYRIKNPAQNDNKDYPIYDPTRSNYKFMGWETSVVTGSGNTTVEVDKINIATSEDGTKKTITLYKYGSQTHKSGEQAIANTIPIKLEAKWKRKNTGGGGGGEDDSGESGGESGESGGGSEYPDPDEQKIYKITYLPNNDLNNTFETETEAAQIDLPTILFTPQPGQLLEGWKVADTSKTPPVATGDLIKPGTKYDLNGDVTFMAIWKDNTTFMLECDEDYSLMPPENTPQKLEQMMRDNLKITYYEDGVEPKEGDTEKQRKTYVKGTGIPPEELEVVITDPNAIRKVGTFSAKVVYKGLYKRTLDKAITVKVLDPNVPTYDSFSITDVTKVGTVVIDYPSSIAYHGDKWDKAKSLVKIGRAHV